MHFPARTNSALLMSAIGCMVMCLHTAAYANTVVRQQMDPGVFAAIKGGRILYLECHLPKGESAQSLLERYLAQPETWQSYKDIAAVAIPYYKLNATTQRKLLETLFPEDYVDEKGWWHTVAFDSEETWYAIALWLTGDGDAYRHLMQLSDNQQVGLNLKRGQVVLVPRRMLREELNAISPERPRRLVAVAPPVNPPVLNKLAPEPVADAALAPLPEPAPAPVARVEQKNVPEEPREEELVVNREHALVALNPDMDFVVEGGEEHAVDIASDVSRPYIATDLSYGEDGRGAYALYKVKPGDSLYSAVVVRFTDFNQNAEIHEALKTIQARSGIADPRKLRAGQSVKIPMEMLGDRYHPQGSERRAQFEEIQHAVERVAPRRGAAKDLQGVVLIMDPGHGGRDQGASPWAGVVEDEIVYDIACRIRKILLEETQARVHMTLKDKVQGYDPVNSTFFKHDNNEVLLTDPPYDNHDARVSANLRWYLVNEIYRKELAQGTPEDKVVFVSLHCDALFTPQLRGAMVYVPGAQYRRDVEQPVGVFYSNFKEVQRQPVVRTTYAQRVEDEALSRNFAQTLLDTLKHHDPPIKVHEAGDPIRNVIRQSGGRAYVPAVLRNTMVPTKVLVEAANLTNAVDRERVLDPRWRQWFAEAFVKAMRNHFEAQSDSSSVQVAAIR